MLKGPGFKIKERRSLQATERKDHYKQCPRNPTVAAQAEVHNEIPAEDEEHSESMSIDTGDMREDLQTEQLDPTNGVALEQSSQDGDSPAQGAVLEEDVHVIDRIVNEEDLFMHGALDGDDVLEPMDLDEDAFVYDAPNEDASVEQDDLDTAQNEDASAGQDELDAATNEDTSAEEDEVDAAPTTSSSNQQSGAPYTASSFKCGIGECTYAKPSSAMVTAHRKTHEACKYGCGHIYPTFYELSYPNGVYTNTKRTIAAKARALEQAKLAHSSRCTERDAAMARTQARTGISTAVMEKLKVTTKQPKLSFGPPAAKKQKLS